MNVIERIQQSYGSLTATEQEAATFILGHLTDVLVLNSAELSQLSEISQPTLSRLYRKFGYASAGEFKRDVRRYHQPGAPEIAAPGNATGNPVNDQLQRDLESLNRTYGRIDTKQIDGIARQILAADHVAVIGLRNNYPMALHLREQLIQARPDVLVLPAPGQSLAEEIADLGPQDMAILFAARRRTTIVSTLISSLDHGAVPTLAIGDSTLKRTAVSHHAAFIEVDLNAQILSSYTAAFSLVALIANTVATLAASGADSAHERIARINEHFAELGELERATQRR